MTNLKNAERAGADGDEAGKGARLGDGLLGKLFRSVECLAGRRVGKLQGGWRRLLMTMGLLSGWGEAVLMGELPWEGQVEPLRYFFLGAAADFHSLVGARFEEARLYRWGDGE